MECVVHQEVPTLQSSLTVVEKPLPTLKVSFKADMFTMWGSPDVPGQGRKYIHLLSILLKT